MGGSMDRAGAGRGTRLTRAALAWALGIGVLALAAASMAAAQSSAASRAQVLLSSGGLIPVSSAVQGRAQGEVVREIDDPHTGDRWLLTRNDRYPGGPGRLVLVAARRNMQGGAPGGAADGAALLVPVIRSGDRLIVEEHTARVDAVLEARALAPAAAGAALDVRLTMGGHVVRAVALAPGRAALQPETGEQP